MAIMTIGELKEQGRLSKGDTLHHSESGWHTVTYIRKDGAVGVVDDKGNYSVWTIEWPEGFKVE